MLSIWLLVLIYDVVVKGFSSLGVITTLNFL